MGKENGYSVYLDDPEVYSGKRNTANGGLDHDPGEAGRVSWSLSWSPIRKGIKKRFIIAYSLNKDVTSGKWVQHRPGNTEPIAYQVESSS